jgi:hypothetical protein
MASLISMGSNGRVPGYLTKFRVGSIGLEGRDDGRDGGVDGRMNGPGCDEDDT